MTSPTPSLPASIREALDEYRLACRIAVPISYGLNAFQADAERDEDAARTALEAQLLALVQKAEAYDRLESRPPTWDEIETAKRRDARIAAEREIDARTPPEDTTPHG